MVYNESGGHIDLVKHRPSRTNCRTSILPYHNRGTHVCVIFPEMATTHYSILNILFCVCQYP